MQPKPDTIQDGKKPDVSSEAKSSDDTPARNRYYLYGGLAAALFTVLMGAGLFFGRFQVIGSSPSAEAARGNTNNADGKYATAEFMRRLPDGNGNMCRFTVFDNKAGTAVQDRIARCDEVRPPPTTERRQTQFSWGNNK